MPIDTEKGHYFTFMKCKISVKYILMANLDCLKKEKTFPCEVCCKTFSTKSIIEHLRIHTKERSFACETCSKTFSRNDNLKKHLLVHTNVKRFFCATCSAGFLQSSDLKKHIRSHIQKKNHSYVKFAPKDLRVVVT